MAYLCPVGTDLNGGGRLIRSVDSMKTGDLEMWDGRIEKVRKALDIGMMMAKSTLNGGILRNKCKFNNPAQKAGLGEGGVSTIFIENTQDFS